MWSLSCLAFFYLVFPLIRQLTSRLGTHGLWALTGVSAAVCMTITIVSHQVHTYIQHLWVAGVFPLSRLPEFLIGVCLGTFLARGWRPLIPPWLAWAFAAAGVSVSAAMEGGLLWRWVTLVPFALLIVALASADVRGVTSFARSRWLVKFGRWSYCFMLLQVAVVLAISTVAFDLEFELIKVPLYVTIAASLIVSIGAAWLLHVSVERPAERALRPTCGPQLNASRQEAERM